jgi:hypothetical protein
MNGKEAHIMDINVGDTVLVELVVKQIIENEKGVSYHVGIPGGFLTDITVSEERIKDLTPRE